MDFIFWNGVSARVHVKDFEGHEDYFDVTMKRWMPYEEEILIQSLKENLVADDEIITYIEFKEGFDGETWKMEVNK